MKSLLKDIFSGVTSLEMGLGAEGLRIGLLIVMGLIVGFVMGLATGLTATFRGFFSTAFAGL